jgi:hypothetical protein
MPRPEVSRVIPIDNEEQVLRRLDERLRELLDKLGTSVAVIFLDDGSKDASLSILQGGSTARHGAAASPRSIEAAATVGRKKERQGLRT